MTGVRTLLLVVAILFVDVQIAKAAPHPAAAGSRMISPQLGFYRSPDGFRMHSGDSGWVHVPRPQDNPSIQTVYRSPDLNSKASLTVRVDRLMRKQSLAAYTARWKKDYRRFGFDVLAIQDFQLAGQKAIAIDLINRDSRLQLRQVLTQSADGKKVVLLTCRDSKENFARSLKACNTLTKTLSW